MKRRDNGKALSAGRSHLGRTVFARREFQPGEMIGEVEGRVIKDPDYESEYCMDRGDGSVLEPVAPFRYLNHHCEPNCELVIWDDESTSTSSGIWLYALRPIKVGDELTIDYGWMADVAIPCKCGAPACRGWIIAADELPQLQNPAHQ